jgi:hypothetical protein
MDPQVHRQEDTEWLFLRFYDFEPDGTLTFNLVTLRREGAQDWKQQVTATRLWPLTQAELAEALGVPEWEEITCWGDMQGAPFDPQRSPNLVVGARRTV